MKSKALALLEKLTNSKIFKDFQDQEANELLAERIRAAEDIQRLEAERDQSIKELREVVAKKENVYQKAKQVFDDAAMQFRKAKGSLMNSSDMYARLISKQQDILINNCDPVIDEAIEFFNQKLAWLRKPERHNSQFIDRTNNLVSMQSDTVFASNHGAIKVAIQYCQAAIKQLENMKLLPEVDSLWIDSLMAGIPRVDSYDNIEGSKPMRKVQTSPEPPPAWATDNLLTKADQLTRGRKVAEHNRQVRREQAARA